MNNDAIICSGGELESVLAGIRESGGFVASLQTGVGGNSQYRVNYFGRVVESNTERDEKVQGASPLKIAPMTRIGGERPPCISSRLAGENPAALNPFPPQCETPANPAAPEAVKGAVAPRIPIIGCQIPGQQPAFGGDNPDNPSERIGGAEGVGVVNLDSDSSQETPLVMTGVSPSSPASGKSGQGESRSCDAASMAVGRAGRNPDISIETRMAALQEKLSWEGKFKRSKSTTPREHARIPHND